MGLGSRFGLGLGSRIGTHSDHAPATPYSPAAVLSSCTQSRMNRSSESVISAWGAIRVRVRVRARVRFAFCSFGLRFTEYIHARVRIRVRVSHGNTVTTSVDDRIKGGADARVTMGATIGVQSRSCAVSWMGGVGAGA